MLEMVSPLESLPVLTLAPVARSSSPADFKDLPYSPTLLLSAHFDASLTADPEYQEGCECGFDYYFAEMRHWLPHLRGCTFIDHLYTPASVRDFLLSDIIYDPVRNPTPLAWRAAWCLGWLSALALTDQSLALSGLALLKELVLHDKSDC
jgi:hypothetical protein